jgi:UDP-N-acetylmuramoyl-L-alanyl-D-glutamate--2,6-diaminopimelate ligase
VIVTDDNPRTEDPQQIIAAIQAGMRRPDAAIVIRDRRQAITQALAEAGGGDIVLIAGKGHEDYQIIGTERWPFSDRAVAHQFLCPAEEVA